MGRESSDGAVEPTVLVVEDEGELNDLFATWLSGQYDIRQAGDGREGLELLDEEIDVVLLDRHMPVLDGDAFLAECRAREVDCRIVMVTGVTPDFDVVEMGFDDYLVKPVDRGVLLDTVERVERLGSYDAAARQFFALARKCDALRAAKSDDELAESRAYSGLMDDLSAARDRLGTTRPSATTELGDEEAAVFRDPPEWEEAFELR